MAGRSASPQIGAKVKAKPTGRGPSVGGTRIPTPTGRSKGSWGGGSRGRATNIARRGKA